MKILVKLLCCCLPWRPWRERLKRRYITMESRIRKLRASGFDVQKEMITTPQGVMIDISVAPYEAIYITKEVFLDEDYAFLFNRDSILIDIGLNRGLASLYFSTFSNIKHIYAYEPFAPTFELARKNLSLNPVLANKITASNVGLGKSNAILKLPYMPDVTGGMSTTVEVCEAQSVVRTEMVEVRDAAQELGPIFDRHRNEYVLVKCDCEGAEYEIFERLETGSLISKIDVLFMEYHYRDPMELIATLTRHGFVIRQTVLSKVMNKGYLYAVRVGDKGGSVTDK